MKKIAFTILLKVLREKKSLNSLLALELSTINERRDKAWLQEMVMGVCRYYHQLECYLNSLVEKPLTGKKLPIKIILLMGLYQIIYMRTPEFAAVNEMVELSKKINEAWASKLVNGVLRRFLRERESLDQTLNENEVFRYSHPQWMIEKIKHHYPENYQTILQANNYMPSLVIRVNLQKITRDDYLKCLLDKGIQAQACQLSPAAITVSSKVIIPELPGFQAGWFFVQSESAQLAAYLLAPQKNDRILDACAAPGGKLCHLAEIEPQLELIAIENNPHRLQKLQENIQRMQINTTFFGAEAQDLASWWDEIPFDKIILDVPCSASGVIRHHPDIKLLRQESDLITLTKTQMDLLTTLWQTLKPGGKLLYVTCSLFPEENQRIIQQFLAKHSDAKMLELAFLSQMLTMPIVTSLTQDGFYYALLGKDEIK
ncbi:MAG: 16S rRNA (cytosine(967)-C(5))-methyltransferase RsmB [Legionellales bacterium]|nr:16S rRNA (cytosine(967)-C(5))-methyltransferase RsmB [Legionellales bacterium]